jgi:hypothetical protein
MRYWKIGGFIEWKDNFKTRKGELIYVEDDKLIVSEDGRGCSRVWTRNAMSVWPRGESDVRRWSHKMSSPPELERIRGLRAQYFRENSPVRASRDLQSMVEAVKKVFS